MLYHEKEFKGFICGFWRRLILVSKTPVLAETIQTTFTGIG